MSETVLVFRKRLLAYSETFIADQGAFLPKMNALFTGFTKDKSGFKLLEQLACCLQQDHAWHAGMARLQLRVGLGVNARWLQALRQHKPTVLHAHFGPDALAAIPIARALDIPLIATFHGFDITKSDARRAYKQHRDEVFESAHTIIAVSNYIKQKLLAAGCPEQKIKQHYIGINTDRFSGEKQESAQPTVLFIGRLVDKKGCAYLLDAMKKVQDLIPELRLQIVGDGPLRASLEQQALALRSVEFLGVKSADEIRTLMSQAWVFCTPSIVAASGDAEGLGMVFLEAQALATPAVSFDTGGVVEAIAHEQTGLTVPEKNIDALAEALTTLLSDEALRREYGRRGVERVQEAFNIRKQCIALEDIYRQSMVNG